MAQNWNCWTKIKVTNIFDRDFLVILLLKTPLVFLLAIVLFFLWWTAAAKSLQSCPTLCNPVDGSPPGSPIPGILQARTLEWVAISLSNAWKWKVKVKSPSHVWLLATPWTTASGAPLSMGFSRQECWSGLPLTSPSLVNYLSQNDSPYSILGIQFSTVQSLSRVRLCATP